MIHPDVAFASVAAITADQGQFLSYRLDANSFSMLQVCLDNERDKRKKNLTDNINLTFDCRTSLFFF